MKLPNAENAIVAREKVLNYLLNPTHRFGASKARFFGEFGFAADAWEQLATALHEHGIIHEVTRTRETGFGTRYLVEGDLPAPDGRSPLVRSVWQFDYGTVAPRLITAYPL
ncbi:MAG: hypothetical protein RLZZ350_1247 [Verrucomicrobiota bacterium]|jgi:hypothetical protein